MTLATHAVIGAGLATLMPAYPLAGFAVGFLSHFVLDSIPHWDYALASEKKGVVNPLETDLAFGQDFMVDLFKIACDILLGFVVALLVFNLVGGSSIFVILCGAVGAVLPDGLQFIYMKWRHEPMISLQKFHLWIHARKDLNNKPVKGIFYQFLLVAGFIILLKMMFM